eukprot:3796566-Prymnesium_polylepis.1
MGPAMPSDSKASSKRPQPIVAKMPACAQPEVRTRAGWVAGGPAGRGGRRRSADAASRALPAAAAAAVGRWPPRR